MSQRILDEREHRRGLVLGLTLAEVLILLLFLLLLALGVRVQKLEADKKDAAKERERIKVVIDAFKPELPEGPEGMDERAVKGLISKLRLAALLERKYPALAEHFDVVGDLVEAGVAIDPGDPPASLKVARDTLVKLGAGISLIQIAELERKLTELETKLHSHSQGDAGRKRALVERTLAIFRTIEPVVAAKERDVVAGGAQEKKGEHDWPPIITLSEARGYTFQTGSTEVSPEFQSKLSTGVVEDLLKIIKKYRVDLIEVVGHTDEQRFNMRQVRLDTPSDSSSQQVQRLFTRPSNLDSILIPFLSKADSGRLVPADNAGLGLARAASVVRILAKEARLSDVRILPLSGGQLIQVGEILSMGSPGDVKERRRIEIRARRSDKSAQPWQGQVSKEAK